MMRMGVSSLSTNVVAGSNWLQYPVNSDRGIGDIIRQPGAKELIEGVQLQTAALYPDDRGYFMEIHRMGQGLAAHYPVETTQISTALSYPGTIKAFHYHQKQTDFWVPSAGMFQVALVDLRADSPTFGRRNTIYAGALRPLQILIPPGVGHGYKIIGPEAALLVYVTDRFYDPSDEGRIAHDHPGIHYNWDTQFK
jgi:dTDP-4-dehydrorhamnose 3,5-epimerase